MKKNFWLAISLMLVWVVILLAFVPPIAQNPNYHHFADENLWLGVPNFWNVVSNLPFVLVGLWGMGYTYKQNVVIFDKIVYFSLFFGVSLTGLGSGYYHWQPNNWTLVFDRIPMTLVFMSFTCLVLADLFDRELVKVLFPVLLFLGIFSVLYWYYTETIGKGDLRLYGIVQFLPMLLLPLLAIIYRKKINYLPLLLQIFLVYVVAKLFEKFDVDFFELIPISGHSLKHLLAAYATFLMYQLVDKKVALAKTG
jgi:hypothetical protein